MRLHGINTKAINSSYNINNILSTEELHFELYHLPKTEGCFIIFYENKYNPLFSKETVEIRYLQFKDEYIIK